MITIFAYSAFCGISSAQLGDDSYQRGRAALDAKRYEEADQAFARTEEQSPGTTNALALRAKALLNLNRFDEAEHCLNQYIESHPTSADAKYLLGYVLFRKNMPRESLGMYTAAAALRRPAAEDFKVVGLDYVLLNDYADAVRWLEKSVREAPNEAEAVYYLGRAYYVQNDFDKAIAAFKRALQLDPEYVKAQNNLGLALAAKGQTDAAEAAYRRAIEMSGAAGKRSDQPYINLSDLLSHTDRKAEALALLDEAEQIGGRSEKTAELRGRIFLAQSRLAEAETAFRAAIAMTPNNGALHYSLGRVLKQEGKLEDAEKEFAQTRALLGTHSSATNLAGQHIDVAALYGAERPLEAIQELQEALASAPGNSRAVSLLREVVKKAALSAMQSGDKEKALAVLVKAREVAPEDPELLYELGFVAYQAGMYRDAEQSLEKALRIQPQYPEATYELAKTYLAENKAMQAEDKMHEYLAVKPDDGSAHYGLGYILMAEEHIEEAKLEFQRSLALQPNQTESIFQLGEIALQEGNKEAARQDFAKVLARDPRHGGALTEMGMIAYRAAKYEEAKSALQQAIESSPSYQKAHYYYALTLVKLGQKTEAEREFTIARGLQKQHGAEARLAAQP